MIFVLPFQAESLCTSDLWNSITVIFFSRFFKWERESQYETLHKKISEITATNIMKVPSDGKIAPTD